MRLLTGPGPGSAGQTTDELLGLEITHRVDSLVLAFEQAIRQKWHRLGTDGTLEEQVVLAVEALEREVNNGGFAQFLDNSGEFAPSIVAALQWIGCADTAAITKAALEIAESALESSGGLDFSAAALFELDEDYLAAGENIEQALFNFIRENRDKIQLP